MPSSVFHRIHIPTPCHRPKKGSISIRIRQSQLFNQMRKPTMLKPVRTPVAILGSLGVCIYVPASRHWLISYSPIHLT